MADSSKKASRKRATDRPGGVKITLHSANNEIDEKAEVMISLSNPEHAMEKMLATLAHRFPPESVMTISPLGVFESTGSEGPSLFTQNDYSSECESQKPVRGHLNSIKSSLACSPNSRQAPPRDPTEHSGASRHNSKRLSPSKNSVSAQSTLPEELRDEIKLFEPELVHFLWNIDPRHLDDLLKFAQAGEDPKRWAVGNAVSVALSRSVVDQLIADPSFFAWVAKVSGAIKMQKHQTLSGSAEPPVRSGSKSSSSAQRKQGNHSTGIRSHSVSSRESSKNPRGVESHPNGGNGETPQRESVSGDSDSSRVVFKPAAKEVFGLNGTPLKGPDGKSLMISDTGRLVLGDLNTIIQFENDGTPVYGCGRVLVDNRGNPILGPRGEPVLGTGRVLYDCRGQIILVSGQPVVFDQNGYVMVGDGKLVRFDVRGIPHVTSMSAEVSAVVSGGTTTQLTAGRYAGLSHVSNITATKNTRMLQKVPSSGRLSSVMDNGELGERLEVLPDGTRVRYVEVPVYEEKIITVRKKETREIEKRIPKIEYVDVEKIVEVPQVEYVDKTVEVEQFQQVVRHVPRREVVDVPREVVRHVPRIETKYVEKLVEVPGQIIEVPQPYTVENRINVPVYQDTHVPSVVAQRLQPIIRSNGDINEVEAMHYEPVLFPVDVYIPKPIQSQIVSLGKGDEIHHAVDVPPAQFNTLLLNMNLDISDSSLVDLFVKIPEGTIPMLPTSEHGEVVKPLSNVRMPDASSNIMHPVQRPSGFFQPAADILKPKGRSVERSLASKPVKHRSKNAYSNSAPRSRHSRVREEIPLNLSGGSECSITGAEIRKLRKELAEAEVLYSKHHHTK